MKLRYTISAVFTEKKFPFRETMGRIPEPFGKLMLFYDRRRFKVFLFFFKGGRGRGIFVSFLREWKCEMHPEKVTQSKEPGKC